MNRNKLFNQMTGFALLVFLIVGCGGTPAESTATPTPAQPIATPVPPLQPTITNTSVQPSPTPELPTPFPLEFRSDAWGLDDAIPDKYSCHGEDVSPPLSWGEPPNGTQSFVLIMDDPDATAVAGYVWDHWLLYNIPADSRSLPEGIPAEEELADGSRHGKTSWGTLEYGGPCPPPGRIHGYVFRFYAIDIILDLEPGATKNEILDAIQDHILGEAIMTWTYQGE